MLPESNKIEEQTPEFCFDSLEKYWTENVNEVVVTMIKDDDRELIEL
jgi:hypothetical protein